MTLQEIFDKAVSGVLNQGGCCTNESGGCVLRGMNGSKCAVGWLIPDEVYQADMEGYSLIDLDHPEDLEPDNNPVIEAVRCEVGTMNDTVLRLMYELQHSHDESVLITDPEEKTPEMRAAEVEHLIASFRENAREFNLSAKVIDEFEKNQEAA